MCSDVQDKPAVMSSKFAVTVMVLGVLSSERDVMELFFCEEGLRANGDAYIHAIEKVMKSWMEGIAGAYSYIFQQGDALTYNSSKMQTWLMDSLKTFWPKEIWNSSSPDCKACDYFLWRLYERRSENAAKEP